MDNCKRRGSLRLKQEIEFYETRSDCSEEEVQRCCEFVKKVIKMGDKRIITQYFEAMNSYKSRSLTYTDLKSKLVHILRDCDDLLKEFHHLLSPRNSIEEKNQKAKSEVRLLINSGLLEQKRGLEKWGNITPSYWSLPEAEEESSSSGDVLNEKYFSAGEFDSDKVKMPPWYNKGKIESEDMMFEKNRFLDALTSVVRFGEDDLSTKPPVRFYEVVKTFYSASGRRVPQIFKSDPKRAVQVILPQLQSKQEEMMKARETRNKNIYKSLYGEDPPKLVMVDSSLPKFHYAQAVVKAGV